MCCYWAIFTFYLQILFLMQLFWVWMKVPNKAQAQICSAWMKVLNKALVQTQITWSQSLSKKTAICHFLITPWTQNSNTVSLSNDVCTNLPIYYVSCMCREMIYNWGYCWQEWSWGWTKTVSSHSTVTTLEVCSLNFFLTAKERTKSSTHILVHKQHNYMYAYDACTYSDVNSACTPLHKFLRVLVQSIE